MRSAWTSKVIVFVSLSFIIYFALRRAAPLIGHLLSVRLGVRDKPLFEGYPRKSTIITKALAEFAGTAVLVCVVVGSGIMGTALTPDTGLALIINTFSTIFALALLILVLAPISGAHLNPAVSLVQLVSKTQKTTESLVYIVAQVAGAIVGAIVANVMFDQPAIQISGHVRVSTGMLLGEVIATAGLIAIIGILSHRKQDKLIPIAVAAWIGSAYFFTSSTSFANPAVTIGRMFSDTFAGIEPSSVAPYIAAQLVGALIGLAIVTGVKRA